EAGSGARVSRLWAQPEMDKPSKTAKTRRRRAMGDLLVATTRETSFVIGSRGRALPPIGSSSRGRGPRNGTAQGRDGLLPGVVEGPERFEAEHLEQLARRRRGAGEDELDPLLLGVHVAAQQEVDEY